MSVENFSDRVLFVLVVYRTRIQETDAWITLSSELMAQGVRASALIYDNGPVPQELPADASFHLSYYHNEGNAGVAAAYNHGHRLAKEIGKSWLFLLDQDTKLPAGALLKYSEAVEKNPLQPIFAPLVVDRKGIVSPFEFRGARGIRIAQPAPALSLHTFKAINSGLLVSTSLLDTVGGYDVSIPLDFSDIAFLEKVRKVHPTLLIIDATLTHHLSGTERTDTDLSLERFKKYCMGAKMMQRQSGGGRVFWLRCCLRAVKLSILYMDIRFLAIHHQTWSS